MPGIEALQRAAEIIGRLSAGGTPQADVLAEAPLAEAWEIIRGKDLWQITAAVAVVPKAPARLHVAPLLAVDRARRWALVLNEDEVQWWLLGNPLVGASTPENTGEVLQLAAAWIRRQL